MLWLWLPQYCGCRWQRSASSRHFAHAHPNKHTHSEVRGTFRLTTRTAEFHHPEINTPVEVCLVLRCNQFSLMGCTSVMCTMKENSNMSYMKVFVLKTCVILPSHWSYKNKWWGGGAGIADTIHPITRCCTINMILKMLFSAKKKKRDIRLL